MGIGDWGLGTKPPIPSTQPLVPNCYFTLYRIKYVR